MSAASSGEKKVPGMLCTTARRKSPAARGTASSAATRAPTGGLAEDGDPVRVPAEGRDAVAHPLQRGDLVEQAPVGRRALDLAEALESHPVVEGHHDDAAVACEPPAVVLGQARHADLVAAALDPHHDRQARTGLGVRRPHVDRQPVVIRRRRRRRVHAEVAGLRRWGPERGGLAHPAPRPGRPRGGEAELTDRRLGERDAAEDGHAVLQHPTDGAARAAGLRGRECR